MKLFFRTRFTDAQCGFKGVRRADVQRLVPQVEDRKWFFDTELLIRAHKAGYKIDEIPIRWTEEGNSKVKILKTVWQYVRNSLILRFSMLRGK